MAVTGLTMAAAAGKLLLGGAKRMKGGLRMSKSVDKGVSKCHRYFSGTLFRSCMKNRGGCFRDQLPHYRRRNPRSAQVAAEDH